MSEQHINLRQELYNKRVLVVCGQKIAVGEILSDGKRAQVVRAMVKDEGSSEELERIHTVMSGISDQIIHFATELEHGNSIGFRNVEHEAGGVKAVLELALTPRGKLSQESLKGIVMAAVDKVEENLFRKSANEILEVGGAEIEVSHGVNVSNVRAVALKGNKDDLSLLANRLKEIGLAKGYKMYFETEFGSEGVYLLIKRELSAEIDSDLNEKIAKATKAANEELVKDKPSHEAKDPKPHKSPAVSKGGGRGADGGGQ